LQPLVGISFLDSQPLPVRCERKFSMMYVRFLAAVAVMMFLAPVAPAQPAPQTEAAPTSKLTGTSFGATPDRDLRPQVISNSSD